MVLLYIFAAVILCNCIFYFLFTNFSFSTPKEKSPAETYWVSLIVCAKNEAENLQKHIPHWQQQEYSNFEIILINDASTDDTLEIMESFAKEDPRIQVVDVENNEAFWGNKKYALTLGIKKARSKRMIFTDADCTPSSDQWISEMTSHFSVEKQLVLGYGGYQKTSGLLNALIRYETLVTALQYFSYAKIGMPYMGVGRNLGYTSSLYYDNNGFMSHIKVASGDDDLFVNEAATSKNTAICISKNAFTYSVPKKSWSDWFLQKRRHVTTSKLYKPHHKLMLGLYYFCTLAFWIIAPLTFFLLDWKIPLILVVFRLLLQGVVVGKVALKLNERNLIIFLPFYEIFLVFLQMSIFISNSASKPTRWK